MSDNPVIVEEKYAVSVEKLWQAITDPTQLKQWYFDIDNFKATTGHKFTFIGGDDKRSYLHRCIITEVVENEKLSYSWRYEGFEGNSIVTWEIFDEGDSSRLKLTHTGLETLTAANPDFLRSNFVAGWNHILGTSLKSFLEDKLAL